MFFKNQLLSLFAAAACVIAFAPTTVHGKAQKPQFVNEAILQLLSDTEVFNYGLSGSYKTIDDLKIMTVTYAPGVYTDLGNLILINSDGNPPNPEYLSSAPISVTMPRPKESGLYSLFMIDPDAIRRDGVDGGYKVNNFFHWGVVNIPVEGRKKGHSNEQVDVPFNLGNVVAQYFPPTIPEDTGMHRYTFLIFRQSKSIDTTNIPVFLFPPVGPERTSFFIDSYLTGYAHGVKFKLKAMNYFVNENNLYFNEG